jgi:hypothetical protein
MSERNEDAVNKIIEFLGDSDEGIRGIMADLDILVLEPFRDNLRYFRDSIPRIREIMSKATQYLHNVRQGVSPR